MIRFVHEENNYVNYKIMKTIKELEKEIMQARIKAILKQYQNGEFAREAEIMHARMSVADSEKEIPLREKLYRIFGISAERRVLRQFSPNIARRADKRRLSETLGLPFVHICRISAGYGGDVF